MRIDLIIESRNVFTGVGDVARPAAIAVAGDRIVAVGSREDVRAFALEANAGGGAPEVRDFGDALVVPGFHDSHLHFFHSAVYSSPLATMFLGESETDCVARMQAFAKDRPNGWLLAQGWREYRWNPPVLPSKRSLDEAFPTRPVALYSGDAHTLWLNSAALDELGLTRDSVPPAGGSYDRDETGELTGIVREAAAMELMPQIMGSFTDEEVADAYRGFFARLADLQVVAAVQPPHMTLDPGGPERDLGPERVPYMWPFRTLLDDNTVLAFGTDSPVVGVNSMDVLYSAVTRQDPGTHEPTGGWLHDERIGMAEALRAYTQGSAASAGRRSELGTLEAGKLADIAVLDRNLLACDADDIQKTKVLATFMGGTCVFER